MLKKGVGILALDGASTLDWTIAEGALETAAARFGGDVLLDGAATALTFTDAGDAAYGGVISGTGRFSLDGGERKSGVEGKGVAVRVDHGVCRSLKKKKYNNRAYITDY